ncbi:MAG TPA: type IV toxin-antitoxin system AbiEi family antitoxin domain-containing protein [Solirubrobacterales bacterium]|nr:type IV toxin-antitoxin system AbiEi family antitoxin domain-containing protein [Solirubrobacterales bacterium]
MGHKLDTTDHRLDEIASHQHGVVTLRQLEEVGLSRYGVAERAKKGRLHRVHRGVYAVGHHALNLHGRFMAAVLACGEGAVASHVSAAVLWELLKPIDAPVHVSVPSTSGRARRPGIHLHRCPSLNPSSEPSPSPSYSQQEGGRRGRLLTTHRHNIPVTSVSRTLEDLERTSLLPSNLIRRATRQAELKGYRLEHLTTDRTRSDLETLFLGICRRYGIPHPEVNVKLGRWTVDFLWRSHNLVVETDFWGYHRGSVAFEDDHARDLDLRSAGYTVLRFDDKQLENEAGRVAADVAAAFSMSNAARG